MKKLLKFVMIYSFLQGETSSGKSSIINLILGEKILPSGITASTSRVCRVKYYKRCMISTRDNKDEELENMSFENSKEMAEKLKTVAITNDTKISYIDIYMPVPLLLVGTKPHCALVILKHDSIQCPFLLI